MVTNGSTTIGQYWYDGDGKRVKKYVPDTGETTIFVYDAAGKEIAEYSTTVANSTNAKVNYLTVDHLGSVRINTDKTGSVISRHDYMPFGEEIDGPGGRTSGLNYADDTIRKQFTGYERDQETQLDFAEARYTDSNLGRYSTPDPLLASARRANPQSFNRYSYVTNNPIRFVDPSGLDGCDPTKEVCSISSQMQHPCDIGTSGCKPVNIATVDSKPAKDLPVAISHNRGGITNTITPRPVPQPAPTPYLPPGSPAAAQAQANMATAAAVAGGLALVGGDVLAGSEVGAGAGTAVEPVGGTMAGGLAGGILGGCTAIVCLIAADAISTSIPTEDDDGRGSITVYHYSTSGQDSFAGGLWGGSSATDNEGYTSDRASGALGIPEPTMVYPVTIDPRKTTMTVGVVPPNRYGPGGGVDYYFPNGTPPGSVGPGRPVPRGVDLRPR